MALSNNTIRNSRVATRATHKTRALKFRAQQRRAVAKALKVPPPSRAIRLPILKQIAELLKRRKEI
jgi:hypothetical protein